jgi:hypothetical protein
VRAFLVDFNGALLGSYPDDGAPPPPKGSAAHE